jgi:type I restriction enzyme S subunit
MKSSGVEWLGEIPRHWQISALKRLLAEPLKYGATEAGDQSNPDFPRYLRITDFDNDGNLRDDTFVSLPEETAQGYYVTEGDVLFARSGATVGKTFLFRNYKGRACFAGYLIKASTARHILVPEFLYYFTKSLAYDDWKDFIFTQATIQNIGADKYAYLPVCVPPLREQEWIAAYLDGSCSAIDAAVSAKRRQLQTLDALTIATIQRAVTRGSNSRAELKPSGLDWLPEVPSHWRIRQIKRRCNLLRGKFSHRPRNDPALYDGEYPFVQTGDITGAHKYIRTYSQTLNELGFSVSKMFPKGTLVMSIAANVGDVAILDFEACFPDSMVGLVPNHKTDLNFLYYLMRGMKEVLLRSAVLTTQLNLNYVRIGTNFAPFPPKKEQEEIAAFLDAEIEGIRRTRAVLNQQIKTLTAYRKSLIHECVTGQRRVTEADLKQVGANA